MGEEGNTDGARDGSSRDHHLARGKGFWNPWPSFGFEGNAREAIVMMLRDFDRKRCQVTAEVRARLGLRPLSTDLASIRSPPEESAQVTWIGHATFLVQFDRLNILTDPVWSERCSPSSIIGPKRVMPVPFPIKELPPIDVVIISHNHYDHLDETTVRALGNTPLYLVPLGIKKWFNGIGITNVVELDWWEEHKIPYSGSKVLKAVCTPCQHFSGRGIFDRNKTLWCSWVMEADKRKFYFAGDTGFCTVPRHSDHNGGVPETGTGAQLSVCPAFEEIGKRYGPFDFAFIPIGAYSPRYFMSPIHCSPEDAVAIHRIVRSKLSIAMHWGTFVLTDEPLLEPPARLQKELERLKIDASAFITMKHGETKCI
ncbi:N-acyl-phosphatidylethanolamine-hydrolyzing phospholipase D [Selaginella moellendorffii]|uniref:N-acyl-phosphatidylethanolamine-hydrolyzing phospholipase D n=1 Tax=Selaginella moellendorffii TaxID=88036 RepID=UPI000D1D06E7|nr:N-acyl-phosphatidylethanolamine-hydrolyzing phospholipase D [Selaginella moellendorffii]XP_024541311.1 N-acyl-phosphatidylethanolamine-hydrolyzing phospholipase D [Selaginella moellendorffii]XP_024541312.1 N-acyl-phosphatidylethanolamine-hydrolyzing phospholipase D [Selaginella moellendorffii]|eukprot:XP_024541309.1 N-acyl-phosphatidylethanolamine-hydrolyzing phospholipase D [Selaginella moellendorffii]